MNKKILHQHCSEIITEKILVLQTTIRELESGQEGEQKSSAGDKHETSRAMMQLEQEKLSGQIKEFEEMQKELSRIDPENVAESIVKGSVVETNKGIFYIAIALGKVMVNGEMVFAVSVQSPLALAMLHKSAGEKFLLNGSEFIIQRVD